MEYMQWHLYHQIITIYEQEVSIPKCHAKNTNILGLRIIEDWQNYLFYI